MTILVRLAALAALALAAGAAQAAEPDFRPYVECVQQSLTILPEYDPRGVDGSIGPGTKAAVAAYAGDHPAMDLPEFAPETAETWCRAMAAAHPDDLMQRVVVATNLPEDDHMGLRVFGGKETEYVFAWIHIETSDWDWAEVDGERRRVALLPRALLSRATYFCLDAYGDAPYRLNEKHEVLNVLKQRHGVSGTHPNYFGLCRWQANGRALEKGVDVVSVNAAGDIVLRYRTAPLS